MMRNLPLVAAVALIVGGCGGHSEAQPPLALDKTIDLPDTKGRIDHLALDLKGNRLFIAELGNGTVDVIDLTAGRVVHRIGGLEEPQGLAYLPASNELVVSTGGDGVVRFYDAGTFRVKKELKGLDDADNVRVVPSTGDILVGYGSGALAIIDATSYDVKGTVPLPSHPEGFQVSPDGATAYVNLPRSVSIAKIDLAAQKQTASWSAGKALENFPMAVDWTGGKIATGFRLPGRFMIFDAATGKALVNQPACGQTDDLFYDAQRLRYYMLCGDGHVEVFRQPGSADEGGSITTAPGGRTGLFSAENDRLYIAVSAASGNDARLMVMVPN